jgi:hypothetical protein
MKGAMRPLLLGLLGCFMMFGAAATASAQSSATGTLTGTVSDPSGGVLPGVTVTARHLGTAVSRHAVSDAAGHWTIATLPTGRYEIVFELDSFKKMVRSDVAVEAAVARTLNVALEVGSLSEAITVSADAPLLTSSTAATFRKLDGDELVAVPTSTRSFTHLLSAEAGVSADLPPVLINGTGNISPSVNGTRTTSTSLFFNGIDATNITSNEGSLNDNISPAPEMLEEVKLQTSLYDASTGRSGGGNFQLVTRSGGNDYHGTGFFNFQHEDFNANDFFYNKDGIDKPKARRNEGGATVGGPLKKNRIFFFGGYQRTDAETGFVPTASSISVVPEALGLISGERTRDNLWRAFSALNPGILASIPKAQCASATDTACISDVALSLFTLRNPATGDYVIPAPRAGGEVVGKDAVSGSSVGGNPLVRQRTVVPSEFTQNQYTGKVDAQLTASNRLSGTVFFADFPGLDSFPDPGSLASPFTLRRADRNTTVAINDTWVLGDNAVNEIRGGVFSLNNSRRLDDPFNDLTNAAIGVPNPATFFDDSEATRRLGHYIGAPGTIMERFSIGGPNDSYNRREQQTWTIGDTLTWTRGAHSLKAGGEFRYNAFDTNLPEEQATEFEKFENFTMMLRGLAREADTQFGVTSKRFRYNDCSAFVADDWKIGQKLTMNAGVRYEFFGLPTELDGRFGNVDFEALTNTENPVNAFIIPKNANTTGFAAIDGAIASSITADNNHTLNGQDWNNVAPRLGFAWTPSDDGRWVVRGGYGIFYDRPSAAFINTVFSNYPFLREVEVTAPSRAVPIATAFSQQDPTYPFDQYLPNRVVRNAGANGTYEIRDNTNVTRGANGSANAIDPSTGLPFRGNVAETFEFRAVDRDLEAPWVQQYNFGVQRELGHNMAVEVRYVGTKGHKLLEARAFNQGYDLNAPGVPDYIYQRFNQAYVAAGSPNGPLNGGATAREQGLGKAFGFPNASLGGIVDLNLGNAAGVVLPFEARGPILGFNIPEAVLLANTGRSLYNSLQVNFLKRMSAGLQFNLSYTFSRSKDTSSTDPGSTSGSGKPDLPNIGFAVQGNQRDLDANYALSDFDRPHRFSGSVIYEMPGVLRGFRLSGFVQVQSGLPYSIFSGEPELQNASQYNSLVRGSGGLYRLAFGRPSLCGSLDDLKNAGSDPSEAAFNAGALCSPTSIAGGYPANQGFGNLGRNVLRNLKQRRVDLSLARQIKMPGTSSLELRWDVFNVFNNVNFALPENVIGDAGTDFGQITNTVGGPRVMQLGVKLRF